MTRLPPVIALTVGLATAMSSMPSSAEQPEPIGRSGTPVPTGQQNYYGTNGAQSSPYQAGPPLQSPYVVIPSQQQHMYVTPQRQRR